METRIWPRAAFVAAAATLSACGGRAVNLGGLPSSGGQSSGGGQSSSGAGQSSSGGSGGGAPADVLVGHQNGAVEVFVDDQRVYWLTEPENDLAPKGSLRSCVKDQCASTIVIYFTATDENGVISDVTIDSTAVYWFVPGLNASPATVQSCPHVGCGQGPSTVVSNIDESSLAGDGTFFYWTSIQETSIFQCSPGNCRATQRALSQTQGYPRFLAVSEGYAYWVALDSKDASTILRVATDGASPVETIATGQNQTSSLSVREPYVYFTNSDSVGSVLRCPVTGCSSSGPTVVASRLSFPTSVVADDTKAYWVNLGDEALTAGGSFVACAAAGCGTQATTLATAQTFWNDGPANGMGAHFTAIDSQYVYWVAQGAAGDNDGQYGFPDAAIHRLAK